MSLLLDALKKAELAKQVAKTESAAPEASTSVPPTQPDPAPRAITTREKLPDITQPIEILSDDLPSPADQRPAEPAAPRRELALEEPEPFEPAARPSAAPAEPTPVRGRAQAEQMFKVKEMDYNPRRPFYLTVAALGVVAVAYGGYVWWQMQPHYAIAAVQAAPGAQTSQVAAAPAVEATPPQVPVAAAAVPQAAKAPSATVAVIPPIQPARPRVRPQATEPVRPAAAPEQAAVAPIEVNAPILAVDPYVQQGYQAFQRNDLAAASDSYQKALAREPNNRDALLGLAAIDVRRGQLESAEARYLRLLESDPRDSQAVAGLVALRGRLDPAGSESRLKTLIANQPESAHLQFALGNQYAQQSRWSEAQAAYFKAFSIDPENADYAFNLAVSLDQMHQRKPALDYYQRALALAGKRAPTFDLAQARARVQELNK